MLWPSDQPLIAREVELPGLGVALSPTRLEALLAGTALLAAPAHLAGCYARYKPHTSCLVAYQGQDATGHPLWLHVVAHRRDGGDKLAKAQRTGGDRCEQKCLVFPHLALTVYAFPLDRHMPQLGLLASPAGVAQLAARLLPGQATAEDALAIDVLRYKPGRRCVVRLATGHRQWLVKLYTDAAAFDAARAASKAGSRVPWPVAPLAGASRRLQALAWPWLAGTTLDALAPGEPATLDAYGAAGAALAALHGRDAPVPRRYDTTSEQNDLQAAAAAVVALAPEHAAQVAALLCRLLPAFAALDAANVPIHGDFTPDQVLVDSDCAGRGGAPSVTVLDLDRMGSGHPAADFGAIAAWLWRRRSESGQHAAMKAAWEAFQRGYAATGTLPDVRAVRLHTAGRLLRLCPEVFRQRADPCWGAALASLLQLTEKISAEGSEEIGNAP